MDCFGRASLAMTYPTLPISTTHRHGLGAWATAKNRGSAGPRAELSGLRLRAGRGLRLQAKRSRKQGAFAFGTKALPALRVTHLERLCGGPMFLALIFWLLLYQDKSNITEY